MKRGLAALSLVAGSLVVAVAAGEGLARLVHDPQPVRRVWDPFSYRIPAPDLIDRVSGLSGEAVTVRMDDRGMRRWSSEGSAAGEPIRIVFLGGSTTENYAFANRDTFPALVGQSVADVCGRPVEVRNAGASAATIAISLGRMQHQVLDLAPDLVVVMHAINDLYAGFQAGYRSDQRHLSRPAVAGRRPRSFLVDWLRRRRPARTGVASSGAPPVIDWIAHPSYPPFVRGLRSVVAVAREHDVPLLLVTQPTTYGAGWHPDRSSLAAAHRDRGAAVPDAASLAGAMTVFNDATRRIADLAAVAVVDLARMLPADPRHFVDECHFTALGNRAVAEQLVPEVVTVLGCTADSGAGPVESGGPV